MQKDLTTGNITPQLIRFTITLVLGNIFQLMYNAIDGIIVGRFVGSKALAAILVLGFSLQIEALPFSYLAGWIGMLLTELPLLIRSLTYTK